jgi:hypothetical protein
MALRSVLALIGTGGITATHLASGAVTTAKIADDAITTGKIAAGAVGTADLADDAVNADKVDLADDYTGALEVGGTSVDPSQSLYYGVAAVAHGSNLASLSGATTSLGGATVPNGQTVLLYGQTTDTQNGLYLVSNVSGGTCDLTRISARDTAAEMPQGLLVYIKAGTHASKLFKLTTAITTLGSDPVIFEEQEEGMSPLESSGEPSVIGTGDGSTVNFDLPSSGVVSLAVFVDGLQQPPGEYSISAGAGTGGVDRLVFSSAPGNGVTIEAIGFKRT